jgi:hypothetical protein
MILTDGNEEIEGVLLDDNFMGIAYLIKFEEGFNGLFPHDKWKISLRSKEGDLS